MPITDYYNTLSMDSDDLGGLIESEISVCDNLGAYDITLHWGQSGFHYIGGYEFEELEYLITIQVNITDSEPLNFISSDLLINYLTERFDKVFFEVIISTETEEYRSLWYQIGPPVNTFKKDYFSWEFYTVQDSVQNHSCLDYESTLPVNYEYKGWLYNEELTDSIKINNLKCGFLLWPG